MSRTTALSMERYRTMSEQLTPESLRELAKAPATPFWEGQARQALAWAADVLEAAKAVIDERASHNGEAPR